MNTNHLYYIVLLLIVLTACRQKPADNTPGTSVETPEHPVVQAEQDSSTEGSTAGLPEPAAKRQSVSPANHTAAKPKTEQALEWGLAIDPICDMEVDKANDDTIHFRGKIYGFCSDYCKEKFLENPDHWLKKASENQ